MLGQPWILCQFDNMEPFFQLLSYSERPVGASVREAIWIPYSVLGREKIFLGPVALLGDLYMSRDMRKTGFCICENKDADQLRGNREADQRLCFRYTDSTIPRLLKYEISSF